MAKYDPPESHRVGNGIETVFGFNFPYLTQADLAITVDGAPHPVTLVGTSQVYIAPAPAVGAAILIYRNTPAQVPAYQFSGGVPMLPRYIDDNNRQLLYALQEGLTAFEGADATAAEALRVAEAAETRAEAAEVVAENAAQTVTTSLGRVVRAPLTDPLMAPLPAVADRANMLMGFDAMGNPVGTLPPTGSGTELALQLLDGVNPALGASLVSFLGGNKLSTLLNGTDPALGAAQLGFRRSLDTLPGYIGDQLRMTSVNVLEAIPKSQWAAIFAGTSVYDATAAIKGLIARCAAEGTSIVHDRGEIRIDYIDLMDGLRGFFGKGAIRTLNRTTTNSLGVIQCRGSFFGDFPGASNCYIGQLTIDADGGAKRPLFLSSYRDSVIDGVVVQNYDTNANSGIRLTYDCTDVDIVNCRIKSPTITDPNTQAAYGVHVVSADEPFSGWGTGNIIPATHQCLRIRVMDCHISGGTHGVSFTGVDRAIITGNYIEYSAHRNIHVIHSRFGIAHGNYCLEAGSAAIILGYGSTGWQVTDNYCYSNQPGGEGAIECYVDTRDVTIMHNRVRTNANYCVYIAIDASTITVAFNVFDMSVVRVAGVGIESEWTGPPDGQFPYSRPNYGAPPGTRTTWANGATSSCFVHSNIMFGGLANRCGLYVAQRGTAAVVALSVVGNYIDDSALAHSMYFVEGNANSMAQLVLNGNVTSTQNRSKIFATRGRAHFNSVLNNDTCNGDGWWKPPVTGGQPSVFSTDKLDLTAHTVNVNYFGGGKSGQSIVVRVRTGITLVNQAGTLQLKGNNNLICQDGQLLSFENIDGVWFELSRNF